MYIQEVKNLKDAKSFLKVPKILYKNDSNWICPLDRDVENIFSSKHNPFMGHGEVIRWILLNEKKQLIGRIAAFYDKLKAFTFEQPTGGFGFFESINDFAAAKILFDAAKNWLQDKGLEAMDGPINFGRNKRNWGLLIDGFVQQAYGMNYTHKYYIDLFEQYGLKIYFKQFSYHLDLTTPFPERYWRVAQWVMGRDDYSFKHFNYKQKHISIRDIVNVYNEAWGAYKSDLTPMRSEDFDKILTEIRSVMNEEFIWIAYHRKKPIAFLIMYPDLNQILKYFNGKIHWWEKPKFYYLIKTNKINRTRIPVLGLLPKYEKSGIEAALFRHIKVTMKKKPNFKEVELSWIGDFELQIQKLYQFFGQKLQKLTLPIVIFSIRIYHLSVIRFSYS